MPWLYCVRLLPVNCLSPLRFSSYPNKIIPSFFFSNQKSLYTVVIYALWIFKDLEKRKADTDLGLEKHKMKEILYVYIIKTWPLFSGLSKSDWDVKLQRLFFFFIKCLNALKACLRGEYTSVSFLCSFFQSGLQVTSEETSPAANCCLHAVGSKVWVYSHQTKCIHSIW